MCCDEVEDFAQRRVLPLGALPYSWLCCSALLLRANVRVFPAVPVTTCAHTRTALPLLPMQFPTIGFEKAEMRYKD